MAAPYHEAGLSEETRDLHRAIASLVEELEAIDWYQQRVDITKDESLKGLLAHNRDEEIEHAVMALEWLRRRLPLLDQHLRTYLFTTEPIHEMHEENTEGDPPAGSSSGDLGIGRIEK